MRNPTRLLKFDWLMNDESPVLQYDDPDEGIEWTEFPFPENTGSGGFEKLHLTTGMSFVRTEHKFPANASENFIPLAELKIEFREPCIQIQTIKGGRVIYQENGSILEHKPGNDVFRYTDKISTTPFLDTRSNSEVYSLATSEKVLRTLVGDALVETLLSELIITPYPAFITRNMPIHVSKLLQNCLSPSLSGELQKLHCQSKALDYLSALIDHIQYKKPYQKTKNLSNPILKASVISKVYDHLSNLDGKLPKLNEIALEFDCSARALNNYFKANYNESIYSVINNARMDKAHQAIIDTKVPLKVLAINLGYSHVNHFNTAFSRRYGYAPGSLRKQGQ